MVSTKNYPIDFVKRTREILQEKFRQFEQDGREVTFLLNCLLGLIVTVSENAQNANPKLEVFKDNLDDDFLALVPDKIGFVEQIQVDDNFDLTETSPTLLNAQVRHKADLKGKNKLWLLKKIRNAIAHQNIQAVNEAGKWVGVRLCNKPNAKTKNFEVVFKIDELRKFAIELSNKYLSEINPQQAEQ
jgi:hypothetical protein